MFYTISKNKTKFQVLGFFIAIFVLVSIFVIPAARAQVACTPENAATVCSAGLYCVGSAGNQRCNLPPPIWNVVGTSLAGTGQSAQIYLTGADASNSARFGALQIGMGNQINNLLGGEIALNWSSNNDGGVRLGRGFTVYDGNENPWFRVDANGGVSISQGLNVGTVTGTGALAGEIRASGAIRGNFVASDGASCDFGKILKRTAVGKDVVWSCENDATGESSSCGGVTFVGESDDSTDGTPPAGFGYYKMNEMCKTAGVHVCTTQEVLASINCGYVVAGSAFSTGNEGQPFWISNGAPSLPTPTNDCHGWSNNNSVVRGIVWVYRGTTGGEFVAASCNGSHKVVCCR